MLHKAIKGVPNFESNEFESKKTKYCLCIPIINEGDRILKQLQRAKEFDIHNLVDIILCDGGSTDESMEHERLKKLGIEEDIKFCLNLNITKTVPVLVNNKLVKLN